MNGQVGRLRLSQRTRGELAADIARVVRQRKPEAEIVSTPKSSVLKRCPFCGIKTSLEITPGVNPSYWVRCDNCNAEGPTARKRSTAVRRWNTRVEGK